MNMYTSPEQLASVWRRMADTAIESGETPLVTLGIDSLYPDSGLSLLALNRIARQNLGPLNPIVVAGGEGGLWLLAMLLWRSAAGNSDNAAGAGSYLRAALARRGAGRSEDTDETLRMVVYAGGDSAIHAAALNIATRRTDSGALAPGMAWAVSPTATPGAERADIELLPLALAEEDFVPQTATPVAGDWLKQVERWTGALLALGLLIGAFVG